MRRVLHLSRYLKIHQKPFIPETIRVISSLSLPNYDKYHDKKSRYTKICAASLIGSAYVFYTLDRRKAEAEARESAKDPLVFKLSEVSKHNSKENGIWVTHNGFVYDITNFVDQHPGGKKILLAAGGDLGPFWAIYGVHNNKDVGAILKEYKIGTVAPEDLAKTQNIKSADPFANDPSRHPALKAASIKPFNAEPPASLLVDSFNTPNDLFYVRNHMPVPDVNLSSFKLEVVGDGLKKNITLDDIKKLPKVKVNATIQCAGNRRSEMSKVKTVKGLNWRHAALGNAEWSGARLVDVLAFCGVTASPNTRHVHFEGLDAGPDGVSYAASVPSETALDPKHEVILAYEMNGQALPRDHGAPLRVIVPGIVGARNVKWVGRIILSDKESDSHWQQNDYKGFSPNVDWDNVDYSKSPAIQELPIVSAICVPEEGEDVEVVDGAITIRGYAWSGGGRRVVRVDVSADKGKSWHTADLDQKPAEAAKHWSWTLWSLEIPVGEDSGQVEIWAKAVDSSYNAQPESFEHIWNLRGVLSNAYHKIRVQLVQ